MKLDKKTKDRIDEYYENISSEELYERMSSRMSHGLLDVKVAELREVFPFPEDKCWDNGYDVNNEDGWHHAELCHSPEMCVDAMIRICKNNSKIFGK